MTQSTGTLAERARRAFTSRIRERGAFYMRMARVELMLDEGDDEPVIAAVVKGSRDTPYDVIVSADDLGWGLLASCDCAQGERLQLCKHVYAVLMAVDRLGSYEEVFPSSDPLPIESDLSLEDEVETDDEEEGWSAPPPRPAQNGWRRSETPSARRPRWRQLMDAVEARAPTLATSDRHGPARKRLEYHADLSGPKLRITFMWRNVLKSGGLGKSRKAELTPHDVVDLLDAADQAIIAIAQGCEGLLRSPQDGIGFVGMRAYRQLRARHGFAVSPALAADLLPRMAATERFGVADEEGNLKVLTWEPQPLTFRLVLADGEDGARLSGALQMDDEQIPIADVSGATQDGIVVLGDRIGLLRREGNEAMWLRELVERGGSIDVPAAEVDAFMSTLAQTARLPPVDASPDLSWTVSSPEPQAVVRFLDTRGRHKRIAAQVSFDYAADGHTQRVRHGTTSSAASMDDARHFVVRNVEAERTLLQGLAAHGLSEASLDMRRRHYERGGADFALDAAGFPLAVRGLLLDSYLVEADGKVIGREVTPTVRVSSGVDWFDIGIGTAVDEANLALPELLRAVKQHDPFVTLSDGTRGMLPETWLDQYGPLAKLGEALPDGSGVRLTKSAGVFLDLMLATLPDVDVDKGYEKFRRELSRFSKLKPAAAPKSFRGTLRGYQRLGLGWLKMLRRFELGGCLADDMGLGKTVQVLALLASLTKKQRRPSLVVAPKSLVFNWLDEAARFTPTLATTEYLGASRKQLLDRLDDFDVVVTTYGTMRRDIRELSGVRFGYAVLDEASAIKNPSSQVAKAARLLRADNRLALTGTPIENRLGDLASILEFLNPGLTRSASALSVLGTSDGQGEPVESDELSNLGAALKPLLLRRTKNEVLVELPDKTEQVLHCELSTSERKLYDELRDHYRALLDKSIDKMGLGRSKIHVLEALLRLRQAACHPGLIDPARRSEPSAKLDTLLEQLEELLGAGHKVLVFSQFTSFLSIARERLDAAKVNYAYLDGKTRDRKAQVERFQTDPACGAFLISLKAGGHGLNLTAAQYVFLLDPWWNPAVEAQAIDRAHRIGQQRPVFAYRMIATDTVEARVLELQKHKRELAEGIFAGQGSMLGDLTADDLSRLLS